MFRSFPIISKLRSKHQTTPTNIEQDFILGNAREEAPAILEVPGNLSLWSIDLQNEQVIFLDIEDRTRLVNAPFLYMAQYDQANRVYMCDVETFLKHMEGISIVANKVRVIYSVGRCGSTLLHHIINQTCTATSLSEPDIFFKLTLGFQQGTLSQDRMIKLLHHSTRFLSHEFCTADAGLVIKLRAKCIWAFREFGEGLPNASFLFLYRNAIDTIQSFDRLSGYMHGRDQWKWRFPILRTFQRSKFRRLARYHQGDLNFYKAFLTSGSPLTISLQLGWCTGPLLDWISKMDSYLGLFDSRFRSSAMRYEDLVAKPILVLTRVFDFLQLECINREKIRSIMEIDAQIDTSLSQTSQHLYPLNSRTKNLISKVIALQSRIGSFDAKVSGLLTEQRIVNP